MRSTRRLVAILPFVLLTACGGLPIQNPFVTAMGDALTPTGTPVPHPITATPVRNPTAAVPANLDGPGGSDVKGDVVAAALALEGVPYKGGGTSPERGFDCSGLVRYVYGLRGIELPHSAAAMARTLAKVSPSRMRPGDLVFFRTTNRTYSHVGIYIGDGRFVHASSSRSGVVMVSDMSEWYWKKRFLGARRPPSGTELAAR
jgi:cell wall-associated NlpC family hydrolase